VTPTRSKRKADPTRARRAAKSAGAEAKAPATKPGAAPGAGQRLSPFYEAGPPVGPGKPARPKLAVSEPGDATEREADAVAARVAARMPAQDTTPANGSQSKPTQPTQAKTLRRQSEHPDETVPIGQKQEEPAPEKESVSRSAIQPQEAPEPPAAETTEPATEAPETKAPEAEDPAPTDQTGSSESTPGPSGLTPEAEQKIHDLRGSGATLPDDIRVEMEGQFDADFSAVRVHTGTDAAELCRQLSARAFAVGNDLFFAPGEFAPATPAGRSLLAHELTHVVQEVGGAGRAVRRAGGTGSGAASSSGTTAVPAAAPAATVNSATEYDGPEGQAKLSDRQLTLASADFPAVKEPFTPHIDCPVRKSGNRTTNQITVWEQRTREGAGLGASLDTKLGQAWSFGSPTNPVYYLRIGSTPNYLVGTRTNVRDRVLRPYWTPEGTPQLYQVDHKREYQLMGDDTTPADNLWLLAAETNMSSGSKINLEIDRQTARLLNAWTSPQKPDLTSARRDYNITIKSVTFNAATAGPSPPRKYEVAEIADQAVQMGPVLPMNRDQVRQAGLEANESEFVVFNNATGGRARKIQLPASGENTVPFTDPNFIVGFRPSVAVLQPSGTDRVVVQGQLWSSNPALYGHGIPFQVPIRAMEGLPQAGYVNFTAMENSLRELFGGGEVSLKACSPIQLAGVNLDPDGGLEVRGKVQPSIEFIRRADIDIVLRGNDLRLEKLFSAGEFNLPGPFKFTGSTLLLSLGTQSGLTIDGRANFKVEGAGEGYLGASVGTSQSFALEGGFNFDTELFDRAEVHVQYRDGRFTGGGSIGIDSPNKIKGIRSANLNIEFGENRFAATGDVQPNIPGVQRAGLTVDYNEERGLTIGGNLQLSNETPGIESGSIDVTVNKQDGVWKVRATGSATPRIPGINSNLTVTYNDGAFTAEVTAAYARGMLSGQIHAGVTNRSVGEGGQLSETADPGNPLIVYGGGQLTVQIAPWLQGTAGVHFSPNGELTVTGEIGLPSSLQIFPRKEINKSIFSLAVQAPIFPGIVAEVGGGLSAVAGIGPGVLDQLRIGITYNPAHEENTTITGDAHLRVPADAGLRLAVRAGIGLGITGASATGGLEIGGTLGIEGAAEAGVHVNWTPRTGLDLAAEVSVHAQPSFTFDISGYVSVRALGFSVYDKTWQFASFRFGSDYRFGIRLPIHYHEGEPFDVSLDDVEFEVPQINTDDLLRGLISRIA